MTKLREKALQMVKEIPEDKVIYVIDILEGIKGLYGEQPEIKLQLDEKKKARDVLQKYRGRIPDDFNYKKELMEAIDEKYADSN